MEANLKEQNFIDPGFVNRIVNLPITNREKEVLRHLAQGKSNKDISKVMLLSPSTIRNHISNIYTKLKLSNRAQATKVAIFAGLLDGEFNEPVNNEPITTNQSITN